MISTGQTILDTSLLQSAMFSVNLGLGAGTTDVCTASGDLLIVYNSTYVSTAGATITSVQLKTNQTNSTNLVSAAEGAVANLVSQKILVTANYSYPIRMLSGQKIQSVLVGLTGSGALSLALLYYPLSVGARLA